MSEIPTPEKPSSTPTPEKPCNTPHSEKAEKRESEEAVQAVRLITRRGLRDIGRKAALLRSRDTDQNKNGRGVRGVIWVVIVVAISALSGLLGKGADSTKALRPTIANMPDPRAIEVRGWRALSSHCDDNPSSAACRKREECEEHCKTKDAEEQDSCLKACMEPQQADLRGNDLEESRSLLRDLDKLGTEQTTGE